MRYTGNNCDYYKKKKNLIKGKIIKYEPNLKENQCNLRLHIPKYPI